MSDPQLKKKKKKHSKRKGMCIKLSANSQCTAEEDDHDTKILNKKARRKLKKQEQGVELLII